MSAKQFQGNRSSRKIDKIQGLMVLWVIDGDGGGWYRLFSQGGYKEQKAVELLLNEILEHTRVEEPYGTGVDGAQIPRSSMRMRGTSRLKATRTPVFKVGIHRAQRFLHDSWLTTMEADYSRTILLRFLQIPVRGKSILMKFHVLDPFVCEGLPEVPLFLFVVQDMHRYVGKK